MNRGLRALPAVAFLLALGSSPAAHAAETETLERPGYMHLFGTVAFGTGLRFNNPYRLRTPLGDSAESVSRTATYADFGAGFSVGALRGFQHGMTLRVSVATEGVGQGAMSLSYLLYRRKDSFAYFARAGIPLTIAPQVTWGLEAGVGGVYFVRGGVGITGELIGDLYYGAATAERRVTTYPLLSAQLGIVIDYEVLP